MFDFLDEIHSQALSDSRDLILKIDVCINWGVSAVLLPELHHCSHFMGSIIPLMTRLLLIKRMIEVHGNKGHHSNASDMTIHAEDSGIDDWSVTDSHTTDSYSVDLLNSD